MFNFSFKIFLLFLLRGKQHHGVLQNLHVDSCLLIIINGPLLTINYEFSDSATFCVMSDNFNVARICTSGNTDVENVCVTINIYLGVSLTVLKKNTA